MQLSCDALTEQKKYKTAKMKVTNVIISVTKANDVPLV